MDNRKAYTKRARGNGDVYAKIVSVLETPKTAVQIAEELGTVIGSMHAMLRRLMRYGAIERVGIRMQTSTQHGYLYKRLMEAVSGEDVLAMDRKGRSNGHLKPTIPGARVVDFSRKDLTEKLHQTQRMTNKERKVKGANITGGSFGLFDIY